MRLYWPSIQYINMCLQRLLLGGSLITGIYGKSKAKYHEYPQAPTISTWKDCWASLFLFPNLPGIKRLFVHQKLRTSEPLVLGQKWLTAATKSPKRTYQPIKPQHPSNWPIQDSIQTRQKGVQTSPRSQPFHKKQPQTLQHTENNMETIIHQPLKHKCTKKTWTKTNGFCGCSETNKTVDDQDWDLQPLMCPASPLRLTLSGNNNLFVVCFAGLAVVWFWCDSCVWFCASCMGCFSFSWWFFDC